MRNDTILQSHNKRVVPSNLDGSTLLRWATRLSCIVPLVITSCTTLEQTAPSVAPSQDTPGAMDPRTSRVDLQARFLIDKAETAFAADALTTPEATSALRYYREVLSLHPGHPDAVEGLNRIVDRYLSWALTAIEQANYARASQFLERAARIKPKSPSIAAAAEQIRRKRDQATLIEILPDWLIAENNTVEDDPKIQTLVSTYFILIAKKIDDLAAKATIYSATDREGRWLYQQINARTSNRLRATLKIDTPSRVELHFKPRLDTILPTEKRVGP